MRGKSYNLVLPAYWNMAVPGPFFFFPFLIHMYFITPISLQPVSLKEQAKYSSFSGAFTDICEWHMLLSTGFI